MNTKFNETIVETNGVRTVAGGGTGSTTVSGALSALGGFPIAGGKLKDAYNNNVLDTSIGGFLVYNAINSNLAIEVSDDQLLYNVYNEVVLNFTDNFYIKKNTRIDNNLTVYGDISATGNSYFANTVYSTTSALSVVNIGNTGPALYIGNNGTGDIASFYDLDQNVEVLHVGGHNAIHPNVGVKTSTPNKTLTVNGEISANNTIWDLSGNSNQWNSVYSNVNTNSANNASINYVNSNFVAVTGATVTGNITLSGNILPYTSGKGSFIVVSSDPINLLASAGTLSSVYQCPVGFRFLPEEISYTYSTINYIGTPTNITITNPVVRLYSSNSTTVNTDLGPQLTFPLASGSTQVLNKWFRSSNTATTIIGRPMLIGGTSGSDTAYLRIDTAYASTDISNRYTDIKVNVILTGYLIKN